MSHPIVLDLETQHLFQEVGYDLRKLKISVVGIYDYGNDQYRVFREDRLNQLFPILEHAQTIVGFNIRKFDLPVLAPYYVGNISQFPVLDILDEVEKNLGFRVALDDLARATLDIRKNGHGLMAIEYFKNSQWDKLESYCLHDVKVTKDLYDFGCKVGKLYFLTNLGKREIPVEFDQNKKEQTAVSLSLPF